MTEAPQIHDAEKVAYSSIVGQSIMLLNEAGACIAQLSVLNTDQPQQIADQIVTALKAPNRHAYKVGVSVGKASGPAQKQALNDLADLGQEYDATASPSRDEIADTIVRNCIDVTTDDARMLADAILSLFPASVL